MNEIILRNNQIQLQAMEDQLKAQYGKLKSFNLNGDVEDKEPAEDKQASPKAEKVAALKKGSAKDLNEPLSPIKINTTEE